MLFNSLSFAVFLPIVFLAYWFLRSNKSYQNLLLMVASYYFYACWDYRFLFLLIFSTLLDYASGLQMHYTKNSRMKFFWFWLSILINLGFLGIFKYYNFFAESFSKALSIFGIETSFIFLDVILPVGISFYTFHGLSYVIDIYKNRIEPEKNFIDYSLFVSFFPLLVAGPIERATHLLPQIKRERNFDYAKASEGMRQILWGLFKKIVIADNCAYFANIIFNNSYDYSGSTLFLGALFFTFQIYGDFSGYSDIALGTAKLFGFDLLKNFSFPYFSRDIAEFWRRWHISLSSWFRDYLYIPLGGSKGGIMMKIRNTFIIFIVSGFWHGANWTFIVWGALNALYFLPLMLLNTNRSNLEIAAQGKISPTFREAINILITFLLTVFAWIFFRADNVLHATSYIKQIFSGTFFTLPQIELKAYFILSVVFLFFITEWLSREYDYGLGLIKNLKSPFKRYLIYFIIVLAIFLIGNFEENEFIYFQF